MRHPRGLVSDGMPGGVCVENISARRALFVGASLRQANERFAAKMGMLMVNNGLVREAVPQVCKSEGDPDMSGSKVSEGDLLWVPSDERKAGSNLVRYMQWLERERGLNFHDYDTLLAWSIADASAFWATIWDYFEVDCSRPYDHVLSGDSMFEARWFEGARLNFAEHLIRHEATLEDRIALHAYSERRDQIRMSWSQLGKYVRSVATALRAMGVKPGDSVVSYMPNIPETVIAMIATTAIGAVWAASAPEFGAKTVVDRFAQTDPKVIFTVDGYAFGGKVHDRNNEVKAIIEALPSIEHVVYLPLVGTATSNGPGFAHVLWDDLAATPGPSREEFVFEQVASDHPLWVLFSSGTSGLPKAIVHGHGGMLLEHLKAQHLHMELSPESVLFFYCTTSWMVWNSTVAALMAGAGIVLLDGNPLYPSPRKIWEVVEETGATALGASPSLVTRMEAEGIVPRHEYDMSKLDRVVLGGAPATPEIYQWFYRDVKDDLAVVSQSGATEICSGITGGVALLPVYAGEMQARMLGFDVQSWSDDGHQIIDEIGELVICAPFPSMPLYFCNDPGRSRYREAYFEYFAGVWRMGDLLKVNERGGCYIYGRSDSTLNRHGIRIGTAEIYRTLEGITEVADGLAVCIKDGTPLASVFLFVQLETGYTLEALKAKIVARLRTDNSPRHVPDQMVAVPAIPYTITGKRLEVPVRKILDGQAPGSVVQRDMLRNPSAVDWFVGFAARLKTDMQAPERA